MKTSIIIAAAEKLNEAKTSAKCIEIAYDFCTNSTEYETLAEYYDTAITVFAMNVNKSLALVTDIDCEAEIFYAQIDNNVKELKNDIENLITERIAMCSAKEAKDFNIFCNYLKEISEYIFASFNTHTVKATDGRPVVGWNEWDRNIMLRDRMMWLIRADKRPELKEFTKTYNIKLPFMYSLVNEMWNVLNSRTERNCEYDGSYATSVHGWCKRAIREISSNENSEILFCAMNLSNKFPEELLKYSEPEQDPMVLVISAPEIIGFDHLLPNLKYDCHRSEYYIKRPYGNNPGVVEPLKYRSVPLVPYATSCNQKFGLSIFEIYKQDVEVEDKNTELDEKNRQLDEAVKQRDQAIADKEAIISKFSHKYGQGYTSKLERISDRLLSFDDEDSQELGHYALLEYERYEQLFRAVSFLKLEFNGNGAEIRRMMSDSVCLNPEISENVTSILQNAAKHALLKSFYDIGSKKGEVAFNRMKGVRPDWQSFRAQLLSDVIFSERPAVEWFSENIAKVEITLSDEWKALGLYRASDAARVFCEFFTELFYNFIKYADYGIPLKISFDADNEYLLIRSENKAKAGSERFSGSGLSSVGTVFNLINNDTGDSKAMPQAVSTSADNSFFTVTARIKRSIFEEKT